jgi:hypothetical protein
MPRVQRIVRRLSNVSTARTRRHAMGLTAQCAMRIAVTKQINLSQRCNVKDVFLSFSEYDER